MNAQQIIARLEKDHGIIGYSWSDLLDVAALIVAYGALRRVPTAGSAGRTIPDAVRDVGEYLIGHAIHIARDA